jgi:AcrR family transcriptional regulator
MPSRRDQIIEAALAVAQRRGLAAMSMRAVADHLGGSLMGLYRHVPTKEALLDELVGRLLAEIDLPDPDQPWQQRLHHLASQVYDLADRYPTLVPLLLTRAYIASSAVRIVEVTSAMLRDAGVSPAEVPRLERMVSTFLLGYATSASNHAFWSDPTATKPPPELGSAPTKRRHKGPDHWRGELDQDITDLTELLRMLAAGSK